VGQLVELLDHFLQANDLATQPHNLVEQIVIAWNVGELIVHSDF